MEKELEAVLAWLEADAAADYQAGVLLLQKHTGNRSLVNILLKKESATNRQKLQYELVKLVCGGRMQEVGETLSHFAQAVQGATDALGSLVTTVLPVSEEQAPTPLEYAELPESVRSQVDELTQLMSQAFNQRVKLSNTLADIEEADGPRVVSEILGLEKQYNELFEKRRRLRAGELLEEQATPGAEQLTAPVLDRADLVKQRNTLRSNISKAKKKAAEAQSDAKRSEYEQKAGYLAVELGLVEMQLALPQA
jgi:hypothetical protein